MFFLSFHISYFFTAQSSRFLVVFLHHSFAQINNITVLLFGLIIVILHESVSREGIADNKDSSFIINV